MSERKKSPAWHRVRSYLVVAVFAYVIGIAPVAWLVPGGYLSEPLADALGTLYTPLLLLVLPLIEFIIWLFPA